MKSKIILLLSASLIMAACNNESKTATDPGNTENSGNTKSTAPVLVSATKAANMIFYFIIYLV